MIAGLLLVLMLVCLVQVLTTYFFSLVDVRGMSFTKFGELWIYGIQSIPVFRHLFAVCHHILVLLAVYRFASDRQAVRRAVINLLCLVICIALSNALKPVTLTSISPTILIFVLSVLQSDK